MISLDELSSALSRLAPQIDESSEWPAAAVDVIRSAGGFGWIIPASLGGAGLGAADLLRAYEAVARGSLTAALILTQRDAACDLLARGDSEELKRLLPAYARGERFTSVGIAQITTSRGGPRPKLIATPIDDTESAFRLDGFMPWVTGADQCDEIVTAAVLPDERQLVASVPCGRPGVQIDPPMRLLALEAARTSRVRCEGVRIERREIIRGPAEAVLSQRGPVKPFVVSAVGLGHGSAMCGELRALSLRLDAAVRAIVESAVAEFGELCREVQCLAATPDVDTGDLKASVRVRVNAMLNRLAIVLMTAAKGTGYCRPHPAERLVREAMFFNVWSAPTDIQAGTLAAVLSGSVRQS